MNLRESGAEGFSVQGAPRSEELSGQGDWVTAMWARQAGEVSRETGMDKMTHGCVDGQGRGCLEDLVEAGAF